MPEIKKLTDKIKDGRDTDIMNIERERRRERERERESVCVGEWVRVLSVLVVNAKQLKLN